MDIQQHHAARFVIRDTLDTDLNIFSVRSGASSHNYTFRMYGPRVLEWTFNNIMLPDSFVNEPASNGFVSFTVEQVPDLQDNTQINNSAAIYFDFNAPIITNTYSHAVMREQITTSVVNFAGKENLSIFPNPTSGIVYLQGLSGNGTLQVIDIQGRTILQQKISDTENKVDLSAFPAGIYLLKTQTSQGISTRKVVKE